MLGFCSFPREEPKLLLRVANLIKTALNLISTQLVHIKASNLTLFLDSRLLPLTHPLQNGLSNFLKLRLCTVTSLLKNLEFFLVWFSIKPVSLSWPLEGRGSLKVRWRLGKRQTWNSCFLTNIPLFLGCNLHPPGVTFPSDTGFQCS